MSRKVVRLTLDHLDELPQPCRSCVFWQLDPVRRERVGRTRRDEKEAWVSAVLRDWGSCGRVVLVDGHPVGYAALRARGLRARRRRFPTAPVSPTPCCSPQRVRRTRTHAGGGLGRMLVQGMARDLIERGGIKAVEAFGDTRGPGWHRAAATTRGAWCRRTSWAASASRPSGRTRATPRMRMDLRSALTWRDEVEAPWSGCSASSARPGTRPSTVPRAEAKKPARASAEGDE